MKSKTVVVNLFGGPGSGKSTLMAGLFSELKFRNINCEMAPEFSKEKVWENSLDILSNQIYIFGKQHHTVFRLLNKVDVVITDSPIILSLYYGKNCSKSFADLVLEEHNKLDSVNIFVKRLKEYNPSGRLQTKEQAEKIDKEILNILDSNTITYNTLPGNKSSVDKISDMLELFFKLKNRKET